MRVTLAETRPVAEAITPAEGKGRLLIQIITPGWGSSGYYSEDVLREAAKDRIWPAGTHMYLDHPSESEQYDRPERSVKDLAAVLAEDARWDASLGALVAEADVFTQWRQPLAEMLDAIGVSIRGAAEGEMGEAEGRKGRVFTRLVAGESVDFVTHAGRGGKVLRVIESARVASRAIERGVAEATANDRREQLQALVKDAYGGENVWPWVRDFDDSTVWFDIDGGDEGGTFQQPYDVTDDVATALAGERTEVRVQTTYVPVESATDEATSVPTSPAGQSIATESKEDTMATISVEEARLRQLETDAGRAPVLESERDTAIRERDEARQALAESQKSARAAVAEKVVREAFDAAGVTAPKTVASIAAAAPLTESGTVDEAALKTLAEESAAELAEASGAGRVRGLGGGTQPDGDADLSEAEFDAELARLSGRTIKEA